MICLCAKIVSLVPDQNHAGSGRQACKKHELYVSFSDLGWKVRHPGFYTCTHSNNKLTRSHWEFRHSIKSWSRHSKQVIAKLTESRVFKWINWVNGSVTLSPHMQTGKSLLFKYLINTVIFFRTGFWPLQVILRIIVMGNVIILWALVWMPQTTPWSSYWCVICTSVICVCDLLYYIARRRLQNELIVEPTPLAGSSFKTRWSA